VGLCWFNGRS